MVNPNTPEWLALRKKKIGSSDAPVIMGVSPWKTPFRLWQEKLDMVAPNETTYSMQRGHDLEEAARQEIEKMTGIFFLPQVMFHPEHAWMMASLDGICPENLHIVEIKCPNREDHQVAMDGRVPEKYFPQLQHQMAVCQLDMALYFSFDGHKGVIVEVKRDEKYVNGMIQEERKFFENMEALLPPALKEKDFVKREGQEWGSLAAEWKSINCQIKDLEEKEKKIRSNLIDLCQGQNSIAYGVRITKSIRQGNIDYQKIPQLQGINLETYRKSPTEFYRISAE